MYYISTSFINIGQSIKKLDGSLRQNWRTSGVYWLVVYMSFPLLIFGSMFSHRHLTMPLCIYHRFSSLLDTSLCCIQQHYPAVKAAADKFWKNHDWKTGRLGKRNTPHENECRWFWTSHIFCTNLRGGGKSTKATRWSAEKFYSCSLARYSSLTPVTLSVGNWPNVFATWSWSFTETEFSKPVFH